MTTNPTAATSPVPEADTSADPSDRQASVGSVLFVCVRNSGKSQMAAGLLRRLVGDRLQIGSAGTQPGTTLNAQSVQAMAEVDVDLTGERPTQLTDRMRLVRDHIDRYVHALADQLFPDITDTDPPQLKVPGRVADENRLDGDAE